MKLGSLFDGIGGSLLSATMCGIKPVWASEIEPFPIKVTTFHFPEVKHLGDITKINGAEIEPVDIIVGGSPCQDLSVAGKRAGMKHADFGDEETTRSGLFMEQIRIVKEMRNATNKPRFMVWENVPGAFSSNNGEDFRAVLEETARIADTAVSIPRSVNGWANAGSILADGFTISWRTVDAQYWGGVYPGTRPTPQRRRRIYLVADFGGQSAPEILFEQPCVSGHSAESGSEGQGAAEDVERSVGEAVICSATQQSGAERLENLCPTITAAAGMAGNMGPWIAKAVLCFEPGAITRDMGVRHWEEISHTLRAEAFDNRPAICVQGSMIGHADKNGPQGDGINEDVSFTLNTTDRHAVCYGISAYASNSMKSSNPHSGIYEADTSRTIDVSGGNPACNQGGVMVVEPTLIEMTSTKNTIIEDGICPTLTARMGTGGNQVNAVCSSVGGFMQAESERSPTLMARDYKDPHVVSSQNKQVRRLTPLECERLQGYPDGRTDIPPQKDVTAEELKFWRGVWDEWDDIQGQKHHSDNQIISWLRSESSDSARYKALGNSFAIPNIYFVLSRIKEVIE